jgi:ADP-ribose pyrophosphatase
MDRKTIYKGRKFDVVIDTLPTGNEKETVVHPGSVAILPMVEDGRICLIRNVRHGIGEELLEIVAGTLEPPEAPESCAARELKEETGYRAARWTKLAEFYVSPGVTTEKMHLFLAEGLTAGAQELVEGEEIQNEVVAWDDALAWATNGTIRDAKTIAGILLYEMRRSNAASRRS